MDFLRKLQSGGLDSEPLSFIKKIYSDHPRRDSSLEGFPRIQVKELGGTSKWSGIGATDRIHELAMEVVVYVEMDSPFSEASVSAFWSEGRELSPEEACGAISWFIAEEVGENKATLHTDNSHRFLLMGDVSYTPMGIDNAYFDRINVYKGAMAYNFLFRNV